MAITYPLSTAAFVELLKVESIVPMLDYQQEFAHLAGGPIIAKDLGPALWMAEVKTVALSRNEFVDVKSVLNSLMGSLNSFYLYDTQRRYPKADPTGSIVGASAVKINSVPDNLSISLKALPASYVLTRGDKLHFDYSSSRGYYEVLETVTANGSGVTSAFAVAPYVRSGAAANQDVTLKKPAMLARIMPGSIQVEAGIIASKLSFRCMQVL